MNFNKNIYDEARNQKTSLRSSLGTPCFFTNPKIFIDLWKTSFEQVIIH